MHHFRVVNFDHVYVHVKDKKKTRTMCLIIKIIKFKEKVRNNNNLEHHIQFVLKDFFYTQDLFFIDVFFCVYQN